MNMPNAEYWSEWTHQNSGDFREKLALVVMRVDGRYGVLVFEWPVTRRLVFDTREAAYNAAAVYNANQKLARSLNEKTVRGFS